jgi:RNA polymerase-binding transcription factor DksA
VTPEELRRIEARLDEREAQLAGTRAAMRRSGDGMRTSELSQLDNHPGDGGTDLHDEELDVTTEVLFDDELGRIAEARRMIAEGRYGTCIDCGRPIPPERLTAMPDAVRCIECQRHYEGAHRQRMRV